MFQRSFVVLAGWEGRVGAPAPDDPTRFEDHGSCGGSAERQLFVPCALEDRDICPTTFASAMPESTCP